MPKVLTGEVLGALIRKRQAQIKEEPFSKEFVAFTGSLTAVVKFLMTLEKSFVCPT